MGFYVQFKALFMEGEVADRNGNVLGTARIPVPAGQWQTVEANVMALPVGKPGRKAKNALPAFDFDGVGQVAALNNTTVAAVLPAKPPRWKRMGGKRCIAAHRAELRACISSGKFTATQIAEAFNLGKGQKGRQVVYSEKNMMNREAKQPKPKQYYTLPKPSETAVVRA
jgi:hypothetical protein